MESRHRRFFERCGDQVKPFDGAGGRTRTDTTFYGPRILSPVRLPFRHTGGVLWRLRQRYQRTFRSRKRPEARPPITNLRSRFWITKPGAHVQAALGFPSGRKRLQSRPYCPTPVDFRTHQTAVGSRVPAVNAKRDDRRSEFGSGP